MAKTMNVRYTDPSTGDERVYTLEYTRKSIEQMERQGFKMSDIAEKPMITLPALFSGAFIAHHKFVKPDVIEAVYKSCKNKEALIEKLAAMYNEPLEALLDEPTGEQGNAVWETDW